METCFNFTNDEYGFFSSDKKRWINKIHQFKQEHPDEVEILAEPENNDGCIYAKLPVFVFNLRWPTKRELTEEQKQELRDRLAAGRAKLVSP